MAQFLWESNRSVVELAAVGINPMLMPSQPSGERAYKRIAGRELSETENAGIMAGRGDARKRVALGSSIRDPTRDRCRIVSNPSLIGLWKGCPSSTLDRGPPRRWRATSVGAFRRASLELQPRISIRPVRARFGGDRSEALGLVAVP